MVAYMLDLAPISKRAEYFAGYNTLVGLCTFSGAILGGYLAAYFRGFLVLPIALLVVYSISSAGRTAGAIMHLKVKDPRKYPKKSSLADYLKYQIAQRLHLKRH
jgi:MFS family permease